MKRSTSRFCDRMKENWQLLDWISFSLISVQRPAYATYFPVRYIITQLCEKNERLMIFRPGSIIWTDQMFPWNWFIKRYMWSWLNYHLGSLLINTSPNVLINISSMNDIFVELNLNFNRGILINVSNYTINVIPDHTSYFIYVIYRAVW